MLRSFAPTLIYFISIISPTTAAHCREEECSQWFSRTKDYEFLKEGRSERYCQVLHTYHQCLSDTNRFCHGNLKFHSILYLTKRQFRQYRCDTVENKPVPENRCHFVPSAGQRSVRYCSLFGDPHVRRFDGTFQTCSEQGARPLLDNRYFLVQVSSRSNSSPFTTFVDKVTVVIRKNNCTKSLLFMASSDDGYLPEAFEDGTSAVKVDSDRKSIEVLKHEDDYVELNMRYIDSSIHIRRQGPYLSVAVRGPEFVLGASSTRSGQLCWDGCRPKTIIPVEKALTAPKSFSKCYGQKLHHHIKLAVDHCRSVGVVDSFFDACVFDLITTGDHQLVNMSKLAQADFKRIFPAHYHYVQDRQELLPYANISDIVFEDCVAPSSSPPTLLPLILLFPILFL